MDQRRTKAVAANANLLMSEFPLGYERIPPHTWVYLSSLLMIGLFFKFNRVWSVRNFDLILLILLAPGLLLVLYSGRITPEETAAAASKASDLPQQPEKPPDNATGDPSAAPEDVGGDASVPNDSPTIENGNSTSKDDATDATKSIATNKRAHLGYLWLFTVCGLFVLRMLLDNTMVRRPLLEPNLSTGGLAFIGCSLFIFLMANVITSQPTAADLAGPQAGERLVDRQPLSEEDHLTRNGPGYHQLYVIFPNLHTIDSSGVAKENEYANAAKVMAILCNLAIVVGLMVIGARHFGSFKTGVGVAALFLMLPYTAIFTAHAKHVIPAALLVWAVVCYRRPMVAGIFIGLAAGVVYYPLFLIPLWISFYWRRGKWRFLAGVVLTLSVMASILAFHSDSVAHFVAQLRMMFGFWLPLQSDLTGLWGLGWDPVYRLPILVAFIALSITLALWPPRKNLGTLISCSAAVMAATQFWHGHDMGGGVYLAWYAPLALLAIFRPNLEDRVALSVLAESKSRRNGQKLSEPKAA